MDLYLRKVTPLKPATITASFSRTTASGSRSGRSGFSKGPALPMVRPWGIDTVILMRVADTQGTGKDRKDCMKQFRAAWDRFSSDPARLAEFLQAKR
jgi:hypothetical protein